MPRAAAESAAGAHSRLASTFARLTRWPLGRWLFARAVCWRAPYFATIGPRFLVVEHGRCEIEIRDRRRVHNHLGTVHAIALCNLAELAAGVMMEATTPRAMRWIPKGMTVEYLKKAAGTMHAVALPACEVEVRERGYEVPVDVEVCDPAGEPVFRARVAMWTSPRSRDRA
nr:hotdog fold domain-containing protein [Luteimonas salinisoli]